MDKDTMLVFAIVTPIITLIILYYLIRAAVRDGSADLLAAVQKLVSLKQKEEKVPAESLPPSISSLKKLLDSGQINQAEYDHAVTNAKK